MSSNHSNNSLIDDRQSISSCENVVENGSSMHVTTVNDNNELMKTVNDDHHHHCGSNNNNNFLSNNNNNNNDSYNKTQKSDNSSEHKQHRCGLLALSKTANIENSVCSVRSSSVDEIRRPSKTCAIGAEVCNNDDLQNDHVDDQSTNSNCSNIDVVETECIDKDEQKPIVGSFDVLSMSTNSETSNWMNFNSPDKLSESTYQNCDGNSTSLVQNSDANGPNLMATNLKKEVCALFSLFFPKSFLFIT